MSYTISLRIRNWLWMFRRLPGSINNQRLQSLWDQILWLNSHKEYHHCGNHLLENLISLAFCCLQIKGNLANKLFIQAISELNNQLDNQLLDDGGHEERSASYHIIILDRLVELACVIKIFRNESFIWLDFHIRSMADWLKKVRLNDGSYPRFNDSAKDSAPMIDEVLNFFYAYYYKSLSELKGIISSLIIAYLNSFNELKIQPKKELMYIQEVAIEIK